MTDVAFKVDWYNIGASRSQSVVTKEIRAIAAGRADALLFVEAIGYDMPGLDGYVKFRDTSTDARANECTYARADRIIDRDRCRWLDMAETWSRTQHPGTHPPRSFYELVIGRVQILNVHQCPKGTDNTQAAQSEGIDTLTKRMTPGDPDGENRPRLAAGDWNRKPGETGPGPTQLADRISGKTSGTGIDCCVRRKLTLKSIKYPASANGVQLGSDHHHMTRATFTLDDAWLTP